MTTLSDSALLEGIYRGDEASFTVLFERHYNRVYGLLFRLVGTRAEAEDLAQEVFLRLYQRPLRGGREHNVGAWLYRVATNMGYNALRGEKRRWGWEARLAAEPPAGPPDPAEEVTRAEARARVRAALRQLPERQVQLLLLRQLDMSYAELAEVCAVAPGSVGTLLRRAGDAFRAAYEETEG